MRTYVKTKGGQALREAGITQADISRATGLSAGAVHRAVRGLGPADTIRFVLEATGRLAGKVAALQLRTAIQEGRSV